MLRFVYLLILLFILIIIIFRNSFTSIEGFDTITVGDPFDQTYCKYYNNTFAYEELYKNDVERIINRAMGNWKKRLLLDAGCGVGRHYNYFKNAFPNLIGIDRSLNMLKYAKIRNPRGIIKYGDLCDEKLFHPERFTHIACLGDTLYHNNLKDMDTILANFYFWLKPDGKLIIHLYNRNKLDPGPRDYSQYYRDNANVKHALTYFYTYTHDAFWKNVDDYRVKYVEKMVTKNKKIKIKTTILYIPQNKRLILDKILKYGFKLEDILSLKELGIDDIELYIFKKNKFNNIK